MKCNDYSSDVNRAYFSVAEAAVYTGIGERTIRDCLNDPTNPLPHYRIGSAGRIIRINQHEIDQWLQSFKVTESAMDIDSIVENLIG